MRKFFALLVLAAGAYGTWQLEMTAGSMYYGFVFAAVLFVAYAIYLEEIRDTSWHHQVAAFYVGDKKLHQMCKGKACPYWGMVLLGIIVIPTHGVLKFLYYQVFWGVFYYPFITVGWLLGFKPRTWLGVWPARQIVAELPRDDQRFFATKRWATYSGSKKNDLKWHFPPGLLVVFGGLLAAMVLLLMQVAGVHGGFGWTGQLVQALGWLYIWPAIYGANLALIVLGNSWVNYGWPATKWAYAKACPNVRFVQASRVPAKPAQPKKPNRATA